MTTSASEEIQVGLAVSLHAPDDELRAKLIPSARRYSIDEILDYCAVVGCDVNVRHTRPGGEYRGGRWMGVAV